MRLTNCRSICKPIRPRVFLRAARVRLHLIGINQTQGWFGFHLGISRAYTSQLMNGYRSPSAKLRREIQEKLGGSFEDWFEIVYPDQQPRQATAPTAELQKSGRDS